MPAVMEIRIM